MATQEIKLHESWLEPLQSEFEQRYMREMRESSARHLLMLLAALSADADVSVGCYCEDESHCHRSLLKALLVEHGAKMAQR